MNRLSLAATTIRSHYQVVVIGSGYGGSIAASRMARAGRQVCLLERGKEILPGEFPDTPEEATAECQVSTPGCQVGKKTALYEFVVNDDINVFKGCGLGGTSLVNANVAIEAEQRVFEDACWPEPLRNRPEALAEGYARAKRMLGSTPMPEAGPRVAKYDAQVKSAQALGARCRRVDLNVTFAERVNEAGVKQAACTYCGDCVSGCNYGSKNTLAMNYLPDARANGAEIFTCVDVRYLERKGERWLVHYQLLDAGREEFRSPLQFVEADVVILSGGTLGSTEILLRSGENGLALSDAVGTRFSGNGDVLGFGYNCDQEVNGIGWGERERAQVPNADVGPCITSMIDLRNQPELDDGMIIEEGVIPGSLRELANTTLAALSGTIGRDTDAGVIDDVEEWGRRTLSLVSSGNYGAARNTQTYLVMAHDGSDGVMKLDSDRLRIDWKRIGERPIFDKANDKLLGATAALGGTFIKNPVWSKLFEHDLVTVHPLGGCPMGDQAETGATNHLGQVFSGKSGSAVYEGLLVCDGALLPRSLGANPLLTIAALAERNIELYCKSRGWSIDFSPRALKQGETPRRPGVQFTETMKGFISAGADDYQVGYEAGKSAETPFEFTLTIRSDDLDSMLADDEHRSQMSGTVVCPSLSSDAITVTDGEFQLFNHDPASSRAKQMRYRMTLSTEEGRRFLFEGFKEVKDDPGFDLWSDTTTLYVTVTEQGSRTGTAFAAKGILRIALADFMTQVRTIRALNVDDQLERLSIIGRFGKFFMGELYNSFGGVIATSTVFDPSAAPRKRRPLRLPAPEMHQVKAEDGVASKFTRYRGGRKGPVILAPGMGTSTQAFALDTIDVSLAEYLAAQGFDIWMFDYRASSENPASRSQFSMDDIARFDYPAGIRHVLSRTGAESVQVVAHCVASASLFMSLLGGFSSGVRSFVASQFTPYVETTPLIDLKSGLHLPSLLQAFGVDVLSTEFDTNSSFGDQAYDALLRLYPAETGQLCDNPVCRRIRFMWGEVFEHENLNFATHRAVHELFGDGNLRLFEQLTAIVRAGKLVDQAGNDVYLPNLGNLSLPISMLQGSANTLFLPSASARSLEALQAANGSELYRRQVFEGYRHMDLFIGKRAHLDVFGYIAGELERFA